MFIRCDTRPADVQLASISYDDLVELSWDCTQQYRLDGAEMPDAESDEWDRLMAAKWSEDHPS